MNPNQGNGLAPGQNPQGDAPSTPAYPPRQNADFSVPQRVVNVPARDNQAVAQTQPQPYAQQQAQPQPYIQPQPLPQQQSQYTQTVPQATTTPNPFGSPTGNPQPAASATPQIAAMPQLPTFQPESPTVEQPSLASPSLPPATPQPDQTTQSQQTATTTPQPIQPTPAPVAPRLDQTAQPQQTAPLAPQPVQPAPTQQLPPQPRESLSVPMPADVLPPQQVPSVPAFDPRNPGQQTDSDQAKALAQSNALATPAAASFSTQPARHVPDDISARIAETPMQNSTDVTKKDKGFGGRLKGFVSFVIFIVAVIAAAFLINQFIFQSYYVEGTSMTPTLQNNDRLIISKVERTIALATGQQYIPKRGQIVILDSSLIGPNGQHEQLIKRVVGLPGERIRIDNGTVTIFNAANPDGIDITQELDLTYLRPAHTDSPIDTTIPDGSVFVMGDNRGENGSYDSRAFGPVEGDKIHGRLWARVLPLDKAHIY